MAVRGGETARGRAASILLEIVTPEKRLVAETVDDVVLPGTEGYLGVLPDRVNILAEIAERAEEIDRERAARARDRAVGRLRGRDGETDFRRAQVALEKSLIRIQVAGHAGPDR